MPEPTQDMGLVNTFAPEALGKPGKRTFRLMVSSELGTALIWLEKEQLLELGLHLKRTVGLLEEIEESQPLSASYTVVENPDIQFKLGKQAVEFDEEDGIFRFWNYDVEIEEDVASLVFEATVAQVMQFADESLRVCSSGRPICPLCHEPINPDGHFCSRSNGHPVNAVERLQ